MLIAELQPLTVYKYSSQRQQQLQASNPGIRDSCKNLPWFLCMGPKEILNWWLLLFFAGFLVKGLYSSQVQYWVCSTWLYPCLPFFIDIDLRGYPMSLSHNQPLTGQSTQSNLMKFSFLNRNERTGSCFISFSLAQSPGAKMTTVIRAYTQISQTNTWVNDFPWSTEFPNYFAWISGGSAPEPGSFLIPFYICSHEQGETQTQVRD